MKGATSRHPFHHFI